VASADAVVGYQDKVVPWDSVVGKHDMKVADVDQRSIEDRIIELLAEQGHQDAGQLRDELEALGDELPVDSLLAAEIVAEIEEIFGISLPATAETAENLRSVKKFARAIWDLLTEAGATEAGQGA
jgi:acyl carrier protein